MKYIHISISVLFILLLALPAQAGSLRHATNQFESARRLQSSNLDDRAMKYWKSAADSYAEFLASDDRRTNWPAKRTMAGISLFMAGRYAEAVDAFAPLINDKTKVPEVYSYGGLAYAMQGDAQKAVDLWSKYPVTSDQRIVANTLIAERRAVADGTPLPEVAANVRAAIMKQLRYNMRMSMSRRQLSAPEQCFGAFWWRYNRSRCTSGTFHPLI